MTTVYSRNGEGFESLYRRFKKAVERSGILSDLKKYEYYEKPSMRVKRKAAAAIKREEKRQLNDDKYPSFRNVNFKFNRDKTQKIPLVNRKNNNHPRNNNSRPNYIRKDRNP